MKYSAYIAECLWVLAVGSNFKDKNNNPTLQRFNEYIVPKPNNEEKPQREVTKADIEEHFKQLKRNRK